ncbi:hypothetical protein SAMN04488595_102450 [Ralstonia sp. 25mfcol4.1]|uniref:hypothetical protein n=1 Tax=Ralstonia sp. 25mfcol4.1 TaxID=1761899 RepID=UPI00041EBC4E|nr:hypothetical protein [Ralstonia sp. 25mfcol4.1]SDO83452.1 hypothetical protein SAMN04488595_102450 [Ralstonia sp. 25mfcol4.1]
MLGEDSLAKLAALAAVDSRTELFIKRELVETYDDFIDVLYRDLDRVIGKLQERKQLYHDSTEDPITMYIVDLLDERGYSVAHDTKIGGHVDIVVRGRDPSFLWLCEAKRDKGPEWLAEGFEQLCLRYSNGGHNHRHGGMLVYCQGKFAARIMTNWRRHLVSLVQFEEIDVEDCPRSPLAFVSEHIHDTSGLSYTVRHMGVALYHNPTV